MDPGISYDHLYTDEKKSNITLVIFNHVNVLLFIPILSQKRVKPGTFFCSCVDYRISHGCHIANYFQGAIVGIASSFQNNQEEGMD